jgi:hypothetical protein
MTKVGVMFLTYTPEMNHPRVQYAQQCLYALLTKLSFTGGELLWHIADDGSPPEHVEKLREMIVRKTGVEPTVSVTTHMGYGANYNHATQVLHPMVDIMLPVEEDWELVRGFDISNLVRALEDSPDDTLDPDYIGCIRLGYLGWTERIAGWLTQLAGQTFFRFNQDSLENHVFAGHPRLETVEFEQLVGPWPEGLRAGYTEMEVCNRPESRNGVAWPMDADVNASQDYCRLFAHVGETQA